MTGDRDVRSLLVATAEAAADFLDGLDDRPVRAQATAAELRRSFDVALPDEPVPAAQVVDDLRAAADPGLVAMASGRYFGFVIGGALPAALAADWLTSAWDQNAGLYAGGPSAAVVEEVTGAWLKDLLGLPAGASFALVTGCQMAHFTALAAARAHVLGRAGWDLVEDGLAGAPPITVLVGADRHVTVDRALRYLGIGRRSIVPVATDAAGRMATDALAAALAARPAGSPTIVCAQVGEVNTGAIDPVGDICDLAHGGAGDGAWVHVDGAFGLWAAASPGLAPLVAGVERADSWATDAHKWLNVPYDSGLAFCAHPDAHRAAMAVSADYLLHGAGGDAPRDEMDWTPEFSRRARAFPVHAALRSLGRRGVADLVERSCAHARRIAAELDATDGVEVVADVVLNQVLVRFRADDGLDDDDHTRQVIARVQAEGECWMSGTVWRGRTAMRISVVNWRTDEEDVARALASVRRAHRATGDAQVPAPAQAAPSA